MNNKKEDIGEEFSKQYEDIRRKISELRKHGHDVFFIDIKSKNIPAKIKLVSINENTKDINTLKQLFLEIEEEIRSLEKKEDS